MYTRQVVQGSRPVTCYVSCRLLFTLTASKKKRGRDEKERERKRRGAKKEETGRVLESRDSETEQGRGKE